MLHSVKIRLKILLKKLLEKRGYYIYPKFCIARDYDFKNDYAKYGNGGKFINLGAGDRFYHPRWKNYDLYDDSLAKRFKHLYSYDLRRTHSEEFPEQNVDVFYSAHTFEHIPPRTINKLIERIYKALKPGGVLRVIVPDADLILQAYDNNDYDFFKLYRSWFSQKGCDEPTIEDYLIHDIAAAKSRFYDEKLRYDKPLDAVTIREKRKGLSKEDFLDFLIDGLDDDNFCGADHLNWFNADKLTKLLKNAGFSEVYLSAFGKSKIGIMRQVPLFDESMPFFSLYVEARK